MSPSTAACVEGGDPRKTERVLSQINGRSDTRFWRNLSPTTLVLYDYGQREWCIKLCHHTFGGSNLEFRPKNRYLSFMILLLRTREYWKRGSCHIVPRAFLVATHYHPNMLFSSCSVGWPCFWEHIPRHFKKKNDGTR